MDHRKNSESEKGGIIVAVILIAIGLLFTGIDFYGITEISYPALDVVGPVGEYELSASIRTYTLTNILGDHVRLDYLPDVVGCLLILVGICLLVRYNKQFLFAIPFLFLTAVCSVLLRACGFIEQGPALVIWIIILYFVAAACELLMEYFVVYSTAGITDALVNRSTNTRILFGWWLTAFCRVFMTFLNFVGHFTVARVYQVVLVLAVLFYLYHLIRTRKYVGTCETVKIRVRRKRDYKEKLEPKQKMEK